MSKNVIFILMYHCHKLLDLIYSGRSFLTFQRNVLPPSSWFKSKLSQASNHCAYCLLDLHLSHDDGGSKFCRNIGWWSRYLFQGRTFILNE
jgi:hypothetical protein